MQARLVVVTCAALTTATSGRQRRRVKARGAPHTASHPPPSRNKIARVHVHEVTKMGGVARDGPHASRERRSPRIDPEDPLCVHRHEAPKDHIVAVVHIVNAPIDCCAGLHGLTVSG